MRLGGFDTEIEKEHLKSYTCMYTVSHFWVLMNLSYISTYMYFNITLAHELFNIKTTKEVSNSLTRNIFSRVINRLNGM